MPTVFTQIIHKAIPAHILAETDQYIAFLDIRPMAWGHTLVVAKQEIDYLFDLDDQSLGGLLIFAKQISLGIQKVVPCLRIGIAVVGLEIPHAHIHLIPLLSLDDIDFKKQPLACSQKALGRLATQIQAAIK